MWASLTSKLASSISIAATYRNWPRVLADHLGVLRADYVSVLRDGASFESRAGTDDHHVLFEIFVEGIYPTDVGHGDTVMDIGANIGGFTVQAARRGARVIAFEPFPENFEALERNVRRNAGGGGPTTLVQAAVGDTERTAQLVIPDDTRHSGRYSLHPGRGGKTVPVRCVSLRTALDERAVESVDPEARLPRQRVRDPPRRDAGDHRSPAGHRRRVRGVSRHARVVDRRAARAP